MKQILMILMVFGLAGCASESPGPQTRILSSATPCPEETDLLALRKLFPILSNSGPYESETRLNAKFERAKELRVWVSGLTDRCERSGYMHWLDFYESQINHALEEKRSGSRQQDLQRYRSEREAEDAKVRAYEEAHGFSVPPSK